jgi:hypothetical protein
MKNLRSPNSQTEKQAINVLIETSLAFRSPHQVLAIPSLESWSNIRNSVKENLPKPIREKALNPLKSHRTAVVSSSIPSKEKAKPIASFKDFSTRRSSELLMRSKTQKSIAPVLISLHHDKSTTLSSHPQGSFVLSKIKNRLKCIMIKNTLASKFKLSTYRKSSLSSREIPGLRVKSLF